MMFMYDFLYKLFSQLLCRYICHGKCCVLSTTWTRERVDDEKVHIEFKGLTEGRSRCAAWGFFGCDKYNQRTEESEVGNLCINYKCTWLNYLSRLLHQPIWNNMLIMKNDEDE